jgi:hypothetical protein
MALCEHGLVGQLRRVTPVVLRGKQGHCNANLAEIGNAGSFPGRIPDFPNHRNQHFHQDCDDSDDHQQFQQRECCVALFGTAAPEKHIGFGCGSAADFWGNGKVKE